MLSKFYNRKNWKFLLLWKISSSSAWTFPCFLIIEMSLPLGQSTATPVIHPTPLSSETSKSQGDCELLLLEWIHFECNPRQWQVTVFCESIKKVYSIQGQRSFSSSLFLSTKYPFTLRRTTRGASRQWLNVMRNSYEGEHFLQFFFFLELHRISDKCQIFQIVVSFEKKPVSTTTCTH